MEVFVMSHKKIFQTLRRRKNTLAAVIALVLLSMTTYSISSNEMLGEDTSATMYYLGEVVAIPGQVVEREYQLPDGGYVKTRVSLNDPQDVQRFLEAMKDAEWLDKQGSTRQP
jgi:hypothetical protein